MSERYGTGAKAQDVVTMDRPSHVTISDVQASTSFVLRIAPAMAQNVREVAGFDLTGAINTANSAGEKIAARLGPDEWLLMAPLAEGEGLAQEIGAKLEGQFHSLVDVSHRNVWIKVVGQQAPLVINAGVALDLDDAAFPPGSATRTLLGKAEVVLVRPGQDKSYRVVCWRSFAPYVRGFLEVASRDVDNS
jgi:sarcosine oxidase subunit gamma